MDLVVVTANTSFGIKLGAIIVALSVAASQEPTGFSHGLAGDRLSRSPLWFVRKSPLRDKDHAHLAFCLTALCHDV